MVYLMIWPSTFFISVQLQRFCRSPYSFPPQHANFQNGPHHTDLTFFKFLTIEQVNSNAQRINTKIITRGIKSASHNLPFNSWHLAPAFLLTSSWLILNFDYLLIEPIRTWKDILAWTSYVLGHVTVPILTAVWLYAFHAPGVVKSYGFDGEDFPDSEANYEMLGYAAGLIRVDDALGTHWNSKGFRMSPIVFGAVPSLHSAMAVMTFFFVAFYARWTILKLAALGFVILQWWSTLYFDHHCRLDLYAGMSYAICWFTIIYLWRLQKLNARVVQKRLNWQFNDGGSTMGMRVFRNTSLQSTR
ncbi:uncharacterized protein LODBEIA_P02230 [Lodderomyces beijingensis]|uniref:Phosphatidic acid phosphatase type 2/haloperoxidase domain-containing protein n=1 Tax=Lodderomyces beijingensis TaxID=1775926 RepID=A0ABP0ZCT0_9ASCO